MRMSFGMIDAKDSEIIDIDYDRAMNKHNAILLGQAQAEYLNGLLELQEGIKAKYGPQFVENKPVDGETEDPDEISCEECNKTLKTAADNLWYS